jgi:hypothetical protein
MADIELYLRSWKTYHASEDKNLPRSQSISSIVMSPALPTNAKTADDLNNNDSLSLKFAFGTAEVCSTIGPISPVMKDAAVQTPFFVTKNESFGPLTQWTEQRIHLKQASAFKHHVSILLKRGGTVRKYFTHQLTPMTVSYSTLPMGQKALSSEAPGNPRPNVGMSIPGGRVSDLRETDVFLFFCYPCLGTRKH